MSALSWLRRSRPPASSPPEPSRRAVRRGLLASLLCLLLLAGLAPEAAAQEARVTYPGANENGGTFRVLEGGSIDLDVVLKDGQPSGNVTVTISGHSGTDLRVDTDGGTPGDQTALTFTPSNWDIPQRVTVRAVEDDDTADSAVIRLSFTLSPGTNLSRDFQISDNDLSDYTYTASFVQSTFVKDENEGPLQIDLQLSRALPFGELLTFRYDDLTADRRLDYAPVKRVYLPPGQTRAILRIPLVDDKGIENNELFRVFLVKGPRYDTTATAAVQTDAIIKNPDYWTVEDSDGGFACFGQLHQIGVSYAPTVVPDPQNPDRPLEIPHRGDELFPPPAGIAVSWDKASYRAGETAKITFRVTDGKRSCADVFIPFAFQSQTADEAPRSRVRFTRKGDDHPVTSVSRPPGSGPHAVKLKRGDTEVTVAVPLQADGRIGYRLTGAPPGLGGNPTYVEGASTAVSAWSTAWQWRTVAPPTGLSFARRSLKVRESTAGTVNIEVNIAPAATGAFDLGFTLEGTATPGSDYTIPGLSGTSGSVSVLAGATTATIPVTIVDDAIEDSGETIVLRLEAGGGRAVGDPGRMTVTILNHDSHDLASLLETQRDQAVADGDTALANLCRRALALVGGAAPPDGLSALTGAEARAQAAVETGRGKAALAAMWLDVARLADNAGGGPAVTVTGGSAVTEGGSASFTLTATPAPAADLAVNVTVASDGDWGVTPGTRTVTIPTSGTATLTLPTTDDAVDEPDGSVSVTVADGTDWTAGDPATASVAVQDDDDAPGLAGCQTAVDRIVEARDNPTNPWAKGGGNAHHVAKWNRVLEAIGHDTGSGVSPMPASEIHANAAKWPESTFKAASVCLKALEGNGPTVTVATGSAVTEGGSAIFILTATPAPAADLAVTVTVASDGDWGVTAGPRTVTIPATGSAVLTLPTAGDEVDEPDGSLSVTVADGTGWTAGDPATASVAVADDDDAPPDTPVITVAAGDAVTEGGSVSFTLTASPAPTSPLSVSVTIAAAGEYGISTGRRTVSIPATGSTTLSLPTTGDERDEPDGSVTATVEAGAGYTVGTSASGTVAIRDDDLPPPVVTIAAQASSVTEGGDAVFTLTADRAPDADLTVRLSVSETGTGDHVAAADEGAKTAVIAKGATEAVFRVATVNDEVDEPDGPVTVTVGAGTGYKAGAPATASVTVLDDDITPLPELSVADETAREGVDWLLTFTVRLSAPASEAVEVRVDTRPSTPVSAEAKHDYWPLAGTVLRFGAGETEKPVQVVVYDDSHDEEAETFELVLSDARGANIADGVAIGTIVNDDPMPAAFLARFGRTVAEQALDGIAGRMSAPRTPGMQGAIAGQAVNFGPTDAGTPAAGGVPSAASGTAPATGPGSGSGTGEAALAMADIAQAFGGNAGHSGHGGNGFGHDIAGPGSLSGPGGIGFGETSPQSRTMSAREALLGSSFSLTGAKDGAGGSMAFWGRASQGSFDGREGTFSLDGTVTTGMLGADYARGRWLVGLALTQSEGEGDYRDTKATPRPPSQMCEADGDGNRPMYCDGAVRMGDGKVEASLTAAIPYAAFQASERLKLWGAAGYGAGEVTLKTAMGGRYKADTGWTMAAAGMRGEVLQPPKEGSGPALAVTSDALWARTSSEKTRDLAASESDVTRLRVGLEGSYHVAMEDGGTLVPKLEVGARHDGGDAETGFGVELGGGIAWTDPGMGLSLDVSGRTLIAHGNDDLKDRGYSAALAYDPAPATKRGASLSLRQDFGGRAQGGLDALFAPDPLEDRTGGGEATSRWAVEAAYGLPAFGGRWTGSPHVGFGLATGARDYSLGWRLTPEAANAPDLSFGVKATRRESDAAEAEHTFGIELTARW